MKFDSADIAFYPVRRISVSGFMVFTKHHIFKIHMILYAKCLFVVCELTLGTRRLCTSMLARLPRPTAQILRQA